MLNYLSPAEAVRLVKSGDTIVVQGSTSIPMVLLRALTERASELRDVKVISGFGVHPEEAPYAKRELMDSFRALNIFVPNNLRRAMREGVADTIPCFLGEVPFLFRSGQVPVDVAFLNVSEPDENGYCSYGISADIAFSSGSLTFRNATSTGTCPLRNKNGTSPRKHGIVSATPSRMARRRLLGTKIFSARNESMSSFLA